MEISGWGIALIGLYIVLRHGFKYVLLFKLGGLIKKAKGMVKNDNGDSANV